MGEGSEIALIRKPVSKKAGSTRPIRTYNLSSLFLLPIILENGFRHKNFINSYVYKNGDQSDFYSLYVLLSKEDEYLLDFERYINCTKVDKGYLYQFDLEDYTDDVNLFLEGKYSHFSEWLKGILCMNQPVKPEMNSMIYKILYRTEDRRRYIEELVGQELRDDAELCSSPYIEEETFYE